MFEKKNQFFIKKKGRNPLSCVCIFFLFLCLCDGKSAIFVLNELEFLFFVEVIYCSKKRLDVISENPNGTVAGITAVSPKRVGLVAVVEYQTVVLGWELSADSTRSAFRRLVGNAVFFRELPCDFLAFCLLQGAYFTLWATKTNARLIKPILTGRVSTVFRKTLGFSALRAFLGLRRCPFKLEVGRSKLGLVLLLFVEVILFFCEFWFDHFWLWLCRRCNNHQDIFESGLDDVFSCFFCHNFTALRVEFSANSWNANRLLFSHDLRLFEGDRRVERRRRFANPASFKVCGTSNHRAEVHGCGWA